MFFCRFALVYLMSCASAFAADVPSTGPTPSPAPAPESGRLLSRRGCLWVLAAGVGYGAYELASRPSTDWRKMVDSLPIPTETNPRPGVLGVFSDKASIPWPKSWPIHGPNQDVERAEKYLLNLPVGAQSVTAKFPDGPLVFEPIATLSQELARAAKLNPAARDLLDNLEHLVAKTPYPVFVPPLSKFGLLPFELHRVPWLVAGDEVTNFGWIAGYYEALFDRDIYPARFELSKMAQGWLPSEKANAVKGLKLHPFLWCQLFSEALTAVRQGVQKELMDVLVSWRRSTERELAARRNLADIDAALLQLYFWRVRDAAFARMVSRLFVLQHHLDRARTIPGGEKLLEEMALDGVKQFEVVADSLMRERMGFMALEPRLISVEARKRWDWVGDTLSLDRDMIPKIRAFIREALQGQGPGLKGLPI